MKFLGRIWRVLVLAAIFLCLVPVRQSYAYVDPGTGSYMVQLLLAVIFGAIFAVMVFWAKIKHSLRQIRLLPNKEKQSLDNK